MPDSNSNAKIKQIQIGDTDYDISLPNEVDNALKSVSFSADGSVTDTTKYLHKSTTDVASYGHTHSVSVSASLSTDNTSGDGKVQIIVPDGTNWWDSSTGELKLKATYISTTVSSASATANTAPSSGTDANAATVISGLAGNNSETANSGDISFVSSTSYTAPTLDTTTVPVFVAEEDE